MDIQLDFKKDLARVQRELGEFGRRAIPAAANSTNNKTATQARTEVVRDLKAEMGQATGLSTAGFRKSLEIKRSNRRTLRARITATGRPLPLIRFGARKGARGVSATAWGKRKAYPGTFIVKMPSGHRGVFRRTRRQRFPVKELYGPGIPKAFLEDRVQRGMQRTIKTKWPRNFSHELRFYLRKFNG